MYGRMKERSAKGFLGRQGRAPAMLCVIPLLWVCFGFVASSESSSNCKTRARDSQNSISAPSFAIHLLQIHTLAAEIVYATRTVSRPPSGAVWGGRCFRLAFLLRAVLAKVCRSHRLAAGTSASGLWSRMHRNTTVLSILIVYTQYALAVVDSRFRSTHPDEDALRQLAQREKLVATSDPVVVLDHARVTGRSDSTGYLESFLNLPFAEPPVGNLRLRPPVALTRNLGEINGNTTTTSCPQFYRSQAPSEPFSLVQAPTTLISKGFSNLFSSALSNVIDDLGSQGEDCLTVNVYRPAKRSRKLPVAVFFFGGGFEFGSSAGIDPKGLIARSILMEQDIMYVAMNYRVAGFGFLAGKELLREGSINLGLRDQRLALEWVADNIDRFGGDRDRVTIWGESAGAISTFDHMIYNSGNHTYRGRPLFRAAIMNSGSLVPSEAADCKKSQEVFDAVIKTIKCDTESDKLACLRAKPYKAFKDATETVPAIFSYNSLALSYLPRPDGTTIVDNPATLLREGRIARVPFIIGNQQDEGTVFAFKQSNISSTKDIEDYLATYFFRNGSRSDIRDLVASYPDDARAGSPFNTTVFNNWYGQYKRLAAILGDMTFTLTRRLFLSMAQDFAGPPDSWSYQASYGAGTPFLGTYHTTDLSRSFGLESVGQAIFASQTHYIAFINHLNPNTHNETSLTYWPKWTNLERKSLDFGPDTTRVMLDDFRARSYEILRQKGETQFKV